MAVRNLAIIGATELVIVSWQRVDGAVGHPAFLGCPEEVLLR
jgi:hypothetical protein